MREQHRDSANDPGRPGRAGRAPAEPPPDAPGLQRRFVLLALAVCSLFVILPVGALSIAALVRARLAAEREQSASNLMKMGRGVQLAASATGTDEIPPAFGPFPASDPAARNDSFFRHLLPYVEQLAPDFEPAVMPVPTYIAPLDVRNPRTNATISYASNGTLLTGGPRLPAAGGPGTSGLILVMERSGLGGAHTTVSANSSLGTPAKPPPFPQIGADPKDWADGSPQGFHPSGCLTLFGDGSARLITSDFQRKWKAACDPVVVWEGN
jgi:hypothetical protein